jgi:hypothetical protein
MELNTTINPNEVAKAYCGVVFNEKDFFCVTITLLTFTHWVHHKRLQLVAARPTLPAYPPPSLPLTNLQ